MPEINWPTLSATSTHAISFCEIVYDCNFYQLVSDPTHIKGNTLDLLLTNDPDRVSSLSLDSSHSTVLDHYTISLIYTCTSHHHNLTRQSSPSYNFPLADWQGLNNYLGDINFDMYFSSSNIDYIWESIHNAISEACDKFIPKTAKRRSTLPKWFSPQVRHLLNKIRSLNRKLRSHSSPSLLAKLASLKEDLPNEIDLAKVKYVSHLTSTYANNKFKLFKHLSSLKTTPTIPSSVYYNDLEESDPIRKCDLFNKFFNSTFSNSSFVPPSTNTLPLPPDSPPINEFTEEEVYSILSTLDTSKSQGPHGITPKILKLCAATLAPPLARLFTLSVTSSTIPSQWKFHLIVPIHKSGDRSLVKNYRPISLLSNVSKVLERLIFDKLANFVYSRISATQFGFTSHRSSVHKLLITLNKIVSSFNNKHCTDVIFLDLKKAFDTVGHTELLYKLQVLGISPGVLKWIHCYLTH